jgi:hypothetical protein
MSSTNTARTATTTVALAAAGLAGVLLLPSVATAAPTRRQVPQAASGRAIAAPTGIADAVFIETNVPRGNEVVAYARATDGTLQLAKSYATGGRGIALAGAAVDRLASQGALAYDASASLLVAVNAGSNTITTFQVSGDVLSRRRVLPAGGTPVSVATHGNEVEVLDAAGTGALTAFAVEGGELVAVPGSTRDLGLAAGATPQFLNTPGEVAFSPDGADVVVTTKANGGAIDVFPVSADGQLSAKPVRSLAAAAVPFGFVFDGHGRLVVTEAATSTVTSYAIDPDGTLTSGSSVSDGEKALCWIVGAGHFFFGANAGSADLSAFSIGPLGQVQLVSASAGQTDAGPIDLASTAGGAFLYVQAGGAGAIDEFAVSSSGVLNRIGAVTGLEGTDMEGIVAA